MPRIAVISILVAFAGCKQSSERYCDTNADCPDPATPYCDVDGTTPAADGVGHTCVPDPGGAADAGAADGPDDIDAGPMVELTVAMTGAGTGRLTSVPAGIDCGTTCTASFPQAATVTLYANPDPGSHFVGWSGACSGSDLACVLTMDAPSAASGGFRVIKIVDVVAAGWHSCALLDTGDVRCWGAGGKAGLATGDDIGDDELPSVAANVNLGGQVVQMDGDVYHTCAVLDTGAVRCWGLGYSGRLGYSNEDHIGDNESPADAGDVEVGGTVTQVATGTTHTCAVLDTGAVRCWGLGADGRLGYGNTTTIGDNETPATAGDVAVGGPVSQVAAGDQHTCALLDTGSVRCWGLGGARLGYGNYENIGDDETPESAGDVDIGGTAVAITANGSHTCALLDTGALRCWGDGASALGYGSNDSIGDDETPASAGDVPVGGTVVRVTSGFGHTCALLDTDAVRCWGYGIAGRLGYGNTETIGDDELPSAAGDVPVGDTVVAVDGGDAHTCVAVTSGGVRCWGAGAYGRLGYGNTSNVGDNETAATVGDVPLF